MCCQKVRTRPVLGERRHFAAQYADTDLSSGKHLNAYISYTRESEVGTGLGRSTPLNSDQAEEQWEAIISRYVAQACSCHTFKYILVSCQWSQNRCNLFVNKNLTSLVHTHKYVHQGWVIAGFQLCDISPAKHRNILIYRNVWRMEVYRGIGWLHVFPQVAIFAEHTGTHHDSCYIARSKIMKQISWYGLQASFDIPLNTSVHSFQTSLAPVNNGSLENPLCLNTGCWFVAATPCPSRH